MAAHAERDAQSWAQILAQAQTQFVAELALLQSRQYALARKRQTLAAQSMCAPQMGPGKERSDNTQIATELTLVHVRSRVPHQRLMSRNWERSIPCATLVM